MTYLLPIFIIPESFSEYILFVCIQVIKESVMHNLHAYYLRGQEAMAEKCGLIKEEETRKQYLLDAIRGVANPTQEVIKPQEVKGAS